MAPDQPGLFRINLLRRFRYEPMTGSLHDPDTGREVGSFNLGYPQVYFEGRQWARHRLVWLIETGEWPTERIGMKNKRRDDTRFSNLRIVKPKTPEQIELLGQPYAELEHLALRTDFEKDTPSDEGLWNYLLTGLSDEDVKVFL